MSKDEVAHHRIGLGLRQHALIAASPVGFTSPIFPQYADAMIHVTVPPAIAKERDLVVAQALVWLQRFGYRDLHVLDYADRPQPDDIAIPVLNTTMTPDISATNANGDALIANVEVSTDIGDSVCGRRWQALLSWAQPSGTAFRVFINERYEQRAREIAREWHLDNTFIVALPSAH